jgi:hypothetical protein
LDGLDQRCEIILVLNRDVERPRMNRAGGAQSLT